MAMHRVVVGHEIPVRVEPAEDAVGGSMRTGPDHDCPSQVSTSPPPSAATQKLEVGQETPTNAEVTEYASGSVHDEPFHIEIPPEVDTQNADDTQEMSDTEPQSPGVPCQSDPVVANASPSASTAAQ